MQICYLSFYHKYNIFYITQLKLRYYTNDRMMNAHNGLFCQQLLQTFCTCAIFYDGNHHYFNKISVNLTTEFRSLYTVFKFICYFITDYSCNLRLHYKIRWKCFQKSFWKQIGKLHVNAHEYLNFREKMVFLQYKVTNEFINLMFPL